MYLIPFEFITAEFRLNLIPVIAFLTPVYVQAVFSPVLECYFLKKTTEQMHSGCTVMEAHNKSHFSSLNEPSKMKYWCMYDVLFPPTNSHFLPHLFILIQPAFRGAVLGTAPTGGTHVYSQIFQTKKLARFSEEPQKSQRWMKYLHWMNKQCALNIKN